jgi:hypothetical protein
MGGLTRIIIIISALVGAFKPEIAPPEQPLKDCRNTHEIAQLLQAGPIFTSRGSSKFAFGFWDNSRRPYVLKAAPQSFPQVVADYHEHWASGGATLIREEGTKPQNLSFSKVANKLHQEHEKLQRLNNRTCKGCPGFPRVFGFCSEHSTNMSWILLEFSLPFSKLLSDQNNLLSCGQAHSLALSFPITLLGCHECRIHWHDLKIPQFVFTPNSFRILLGDLDILEFSKRKRKQTSGIGTLLGGADNEEVAPSCYSRSDCIPPRLRKRKLPIHHCIAECVHVTPDQGYCMLARNRSQVDTCLIGEVLLRPLAKKFPVLQPLADAAVQTLQFGRMGLQELVRSLIASSLTCDG